MMELQGIGKAYAGKPAIADFSLQVGDDEYLTLLGPSGSGKTTLLRLITGLETPDQGVILLDGAPISHLPPHLRGLGFVQQNYALFPHLSVFDNVAFGLRHRLLEPVSDEAEVQRRVHAMLALVGLEDLDARLVNQLSGGQKQRVSLARTLVAEPRICLLDEPLGALDANLRERMTVELRRIRATLGVSFLHVTGNETEALKMGSRMIVLDQGRALQIDAPDVVFRQPATVDVARFVNNYNVLEGTSCDGRFVVCDVPLGMPETDAAVHHYCVRHDRISVQAPDSTLAAGHTGLACEFLASEFMGSQVIYFFRQPDGSLIEVERHLSRESPVHIEPGAQRLLSWAVDDTLLYGADLNLMNVPATARAVH